MQHMLFKFTKRVNKSLKNLWHYVAHIQIGQL